ncbi:hypothetical protein B0H14DRAFT_3435139 [Mycena olivaceomarginata]|nr:hypothetical protein B0H14DRAFT_3435139 [Mycena olivaceomarginata]
MSINVDVDPAYRSSLSTLFDTLHKWVSKALDTATDQFFTFDTIIEDSSPKQHLYKAINDLKTLVDRFAQPKSSVNDVLRSAQRLSSAVRSDSVEVKAVVKKFFDYAQKSLDDPKYPHSEEAQLVQRNIRQQGRKLLDANTDAGRAWAELEETAQTFGATLAANEDVQRLRTAHAQLGQDVESGLVEAGEQAETGVLERALWFWCDLFTVYAPHMLALLKDTPIPRTKFVNKDTELVLENLDISLFGINPAHIFIRNFTNIDVDLGVHTLETGQGTTGVGTFTHVRLQAVQLALKNVSFYYNDKTATMLPSEYTGLLVALDLDSSSDDHNLKKTASTAKAVEMISMITVLLIPEMFLHEFVHLGPMLPGCYFTSEPAPTSRCKHEITRTIAPVITGLQFAFYAVPPLLVTFTMFILTIHKCLATLRQDKRTDLAIINLFLRDAIVWLVVVFFFYGAEMIIWATARPTLMQVLVVPSLPLLPHILPHLPRDPLTVHFLLFLVLIILFAKLKSKSTDNSTSSLLPLNSNKLAQDEDEDRDGDGDGDGDGYEEEDEEVEESEKLLPPLPPLKPVRAAWRTLK